MGYKVYSKKAAQNADKDAVFFRLIQEKNDVALCLVDREGKAIDGTNILLVDSDLDGIVLIPGFRGNISLKTDIQGHVITEKGQNLRGIGGFLGALVSKIKKDHACEETH